MFQIRRGLDGSLSATTQETVNGQDYQITTMKRYSGEIVCSAQPGKYSPAKDGCFAGFSYSMFIDKPVTLFKASGRATESKIREVHNQGLLIFDETIAKAKKAEPKPFEIEPGQLIIFDGPTNENSNVYAVYQIEAGKWGKFYKAVNIESLNLLSIEHPRQWSEKFGIGFYYTPGEKMNIETLNNLVIDAKLKAKADSERRESENILQKAATAAKIEEGQKIVNIPDWAKSIIVAEFREDDSDIMTDYFASHTEKFYVLAYSRHEKKDFREMRKAALNCPETAYLNQAPESHEHRENYTGGHGYFLGESKYSGIIINKDRYFKPETLYLAAAEGRYFAESEPQQPTPPATEPETTPEPEPTPQAPEPTPAHDFDFYDLKEPETTPEPETTLRDEINKTIDFFVETDREIFGQVREITREICKVQNYEPESLKDEPETTPEPEPIHQAPEPEPETTPEPETQILNPGDRVQVVFQPEKVNGKKNPYVMKQGKIDSFDGLYYWVNLEISKKETIKAGFKIDNLYRLQQAEAPAAVEIMPELTPAPAAVEIAPEPTPAPAPVETIAPQPPAPEKVKRPAKQRKPAPAKNRTPAPAKIAAVYSDFCNFVDSYFSNVSIAF